MSTAIVIPAANLGTDSYNLLSALMFSIDENETYKHFPIVICFDNCGEEFIEFFKEKYPYIHSIINSKQNLNFARNANNGLRYAHKVLGTSAMVVNMDCILPGPQHLLKIPGTGLASPRSVHLIESMPIGAEDLIKLNENQTGGLTREQNDDKVPAYCFFISKEVMDKVGYFYEPFIATFEDDDYCARAHLAGFPLEVVDVNIVHFGSHHDTAKVGKSRSGSYGPGWLGINLSVYRDKWGIPSDVPHSECIKWIREHHVWEDEMKED
jgi:GT2 family glycosyltransferase